MAMKRGIKIDWSDPKLTGMVGMPPSNEIPNIEYPPVLTEKDLQVMEVHMEGGWRLKSDFYRLIKEVRRYRNGN